MNEVTTILFEPERVLLLPEAAEALKESGEDPNLFLGRHVTGDWGELRSEEVTANFIALAIGGELFSRYRTARGKQLVMATEADRSRTYIYLEDRTSEGETMEKSGVSTDMLFGSFTSAVGLALGEMLLLTGRPEKLGECLASIEATAYATLLSSCASPEGAPVVKSLSSAALRVVKVWHEDFDGYDGLGKAIETLQDVLESMGIEYVPPDDAPQEE